MKLHLALISLAALLLASCATSDSNTLAPQAVPVPPPVATPNIGRAEEQVRKVEDKVEDVEDAVREVGSQLEAARASAKSIEAIAEEAYANGLEAGSSSATDLRAFVSELKDELKRSTEARESAMVALAQTKVELDKTEQANALLRTQITTMDEQNKALAARLNEANARIRIGVKIAKERDEALTKLTKTEEKLSGARKYVIGVWIAIVLIILYVVLKVLIATGKITPQGRMASFLFR